MKENIKTNLHVMLEERMRHKQRYFNAISFPDPTVVVDCYRNFDNFEHLAKGDVLVYAEVANSTPLLSDGYSIIDIDFIKHRAYTNGAFSSKDVLKMEKSLVGTRIYAGFSVVESLSKGVFIDSWTINETFKKMDTTILCGLAWIDIGYFKHYELPNNTAYLAFMINIDYERCSMCGKTFNGDQMPCEHINRQHCYSVYGFKRFDGFSMGR